MLIVVLLGNQDKEFCECIFSNLSKKRTVIFVNSNGISKKGSGKELMLVSYPEKCRINADTVLVILGDECKSVPSEINDGIFIINSKNKRQAELLNGQNYLAITCGASPKDTITYSSRTDDETVLSLQRSVKTLSGKTTEPFELPVNTSVNESVFATLASQAVLIIDDEYTSFQN